MRIIDKKLLRSFHEQMTVCEICDQAPATDVHHVICRGMGSGSRLDIPINLLAACRDCHDKAHAGKLDRRELLGIAAERELWKLLRTPK